MITPYISTVTVVFDPEEHNSGMTGIVRLQLTGEVDDVAEVMASLVGLGDYDLVEGGRIDCVWGATGGSSTR